MLKTMRERTNTLKCRHEDDAGAGNACVKELWLSAATEPKRSLQKAPDPKGRRLVFKLRG